MTNEIKTEALRSLEFLLRESRISGTEFPEPFARAKLSGVVSPEVFAEVNSSIVVAIGKFIRANRTKKVSRKANRTQVLKMAIEVVKGGAE